MKSEYRPVYCTICGWRGKRRYQKRASFNCPRCADNDIIGNVVPSQLFNYEDNPHSGKCASEERAKLAEELKDIKRQVLITELKKL